MNHKARRRISRINKVRDYSVRHKNDEFVNGPNKAPRTKTHRPKYVTRQKLITVRTPNGIGLARTVNGFFRNAINFSRSALQLKKGLGKDKIRKGQNTSMIASVPKLKRATGLMTKGRREMQKMLASGLEVSPSIVNLNLRKFG